jgi:hypothetical protein
MHFWMKNILKNNRKLDHLISSQKPVKFLYWRVKGQAFDHPLFMDVHIW